MLIERARRDVEQGDNGECSRRRKQLERRRQELDRDLAAVRRNWAREEDGELYAELRSELIRLKSERDAVERELTQLQQPSARHGDIEHEVNAAMSLMDDITRITSDPQARADINPLLQNLGIRIGLRFEQALKGKKRKTRRLAGESHGFRKSAIACADPRAPESPTGVRASATSCYDCRM